MSTAYLYSPRELVEIDYYDRLWLVASPTGTELSVSFLFVVNLLGDKKYKLYNTHSLYFALCNF